MSKKSFLALENGMIFYGISGGANCDKLGEIVFNTGMTGYQEIISDPSYSGQIVTLTTAEVGNYGCNLSDMESRGLFANGLILQGLNKPSNFRSTTSLQSMLRENNVPCLYGVDTRYLTTILRSYGTMKGFLHCSDDSISEDEAIEKAKKWHGLDNQDYATKVSVDMPYNWNESGDIKIAAYDFGIKYNILRNLADQKLQVTVIPAWTTSQEVLAMNVKGVFFSNGPADPRAVKGAIQVAKELSGKLPVMGICLGHQILGLANGAEVERLKFGHHGCNHPVKNLITNRIEITSQNHNFAICEKSLPKKLELTHINLNDNTIEGFRLKNKPVFSVQFHPEAAPGPHDSQNLFNDFRKFLEDNN